VEILEEGSAMARTLASESMAEVTDAMRLL